MSEDKRMHPDVPTAQEALRDPAALYKLRSLTEREAARTQGWKNGFVLGAITAVLLMLAIRLIIM